MTRRVLVVGSGASGVHFALSVLRKGYEVTMVDVGRDEASAKLPDATFDELKDRLEDPVSYFLGNDFRGVVLPNMAKEYYGFPPGKQYVFEPPDGFSVTAEGFEPLFSFAKGGLAQAWTGGCYPFNDDDLAAFPFNYDALASHYSEVAARIGVTGLSDDLTRFLPLHDNLLPALRLDRGSRELLGAYERRRSRVNRRFRTWLGRTRVATLSHVAGERGACQYLGRCLWGCPVRALYTPSETLNELQRFRAFRYLSGREVSHFKIAEDGRAVTLVCRRLEDRGIEELSIDRLVLAAGALGSAAIVLRSLYHKWGSSPRLTGLMDNRQVLVPFLQLRMLGKQPDQDSYQYHMVGMGIADDDPANYVHAQITTLSTALLHPVVQKLPFDLRSSLLVTRATRAALGVVNVNFSDRRRTDCWVSLDPTGRSDFPTLKIHYTPPADESARMARGLRTVRRVLAELGCVVPPGMQHVRPMGASAHYAGLLPMTASAGAYTTTPDGRSRDFPNLYLADGVTFPSLPAKNLTFTLMANATRIADASF